VTVFPFLEIFVNSPAMTSEVWSKFVLALSLCATLITALPIGTQYAAVTDPLPTGTPSVSPFDFAYINDYITYVGEYNLQPYIDGLTELKNLTKKLKRDINTELIFRHGLTTHFHVRNAQRSRLFDDQCSRANTLISDFHQLLSSPNQSSEQGGKNNDETTGKRSNPMVSGRGETGETRKKRAIQESQNSGRKETADALYPFLREIFGVPNHGDYRRIVHQILSLSGEGKGKKSISKGGREAGELRRKRAILESQRRRRKRAINALGTLLKEVTGVPDNDDYEKVVHQLGVLSREERERDEIEKSLGSTFKMVTSEIREERGKINEIIKCLREKGEHILTVADNEYALLNTIDFFSMSEKLLFLCERKYRTIQSMSDESKHHFLSPAAIPPPNLTSIIHENRFVGGLTPVLTDPKDYYEQKLVRGGFKKSSFFLTLNIPMGSIEERLSLQLLGKEEKEKANFDLSPFHAKIINKRYGTFAYLTEGDLQKCLQKKQTFFCEKRKIEMFSNEYLAYDISVNTLIIKSVFNESKCEVFGGEGERLPHITLGYTNLISLPSSSEIKCGKLLHIQRISVLQTKKYNVSSSPAHMNSIPDLVASIHLKNKTLSHETRIQKLEEGSGGLWNATRHIGQRVKQMISKNENAVLSAFTWDVTDTSTTLTVTLLLFACLFAYVRWSNKNIQKKLDALK
jgi:hypothetical protein